MDWIRNLDTRLFLFLNGHHNETWDGIMWWISGKTSMWPLYLVLLIFIVWKKKWQVIPVILFIAGVIALTDQTSVHLFKNVFQRLRPCHEPALRDLVHLVNDRCGGKYGFISSHAANSFGVAFLLIPWIRSRWFTTILVIWAVAVSCSRIYLGVHYPGDVIAGAIWGAGCGLLLFLLFRLFMHILPRSWWISGDDPAEGGV